MSDRRLDALLSQLVDRTRGTARDLRAFVFVVVHPTGVAVLAADRWTGRLTVRHSPNPGEVLKLLPAEGLNGRHAVIGRVPGGNHGAARAVLLWARAGRGPITSLTPQLDAISDVTAGFADLSTLPAELRPVLVLAGFHCDPKLSFRPRVEFLDDHRAARGLAEADERIDRYRALAADARAPRHNIQE